MATDQQDFELWLRSKFDGDALASARAAFEKTKRTADDAKVSLDDLGYSAKNLKQMLAEVFAITELISQFKEGFEQVAALEQAFNQLERAAKANGENFDVVKGKVTEFAESLKKMAGIDDDAVIKQVTKLYTATGDLSNSMGLVRLAADVAASGVGVDFNQALQLVTGAAQGQTRALTQLGLKTDEVGGKTLSAQEALDKIEKAFGGNAQKAKGLTVEVNKLNEQWEDVRNNLVEKLTPALGVAIKGVQSFFTILNGLWEAAAEFIVRSITGVGAFGDAVLKLVSGDVVGAKDAAKAGLSEISGIGKEATRIAEETAKKVKAIWDETAKGPTTPTKAPRAPGGGGGENGDGYDPVVEAENFRLEQIRKLREKLEDDALKSEATFQKNVTKLRALGQRESIRIEKELDEERERLMAAQTRRIRDEVMIRKAAEEAKKEAQMAAAGAVIGAAGAIFGQSKAIASADAAISTWAGAARALKDWPAPYSYVIAAATIAAGLARVAQINSTQPTTQGSGFDDPRNDQAAYLGGRRWAADMIGEFTKGVSSGWASGMTAGVTNNTTNDNRRSYNVHLHGAGLIDPNNVQMVKQLKRTLDVIDVQIEGQRATARR